MGSVKEYEKIMNRYHSVPLRNPLLLSIAVEILNDINESSFEKVPYLKKSTLSTKDNVEFCFDWWFYYESHINRLLSLTANKFTEDLQTIIDKGAARLDLLHRRLHFHALTSAKYVAATDDSPERSI